MTKKTQFKFPTERYLNVIKQGYKDCELNNSYLLKALKNQIRIIYWFVFCLKKANFKLQI